MVDAYTQFWRDALAINARASRPQYWWPMLVNVAAAAAIIAVSVFVSGALTGAAQHSTWPIPAEAAILLAVLTPPTVTLSIRRLHDTGRSGWWLAVCAIPLGVFLILAWHILPPDPQPNRWGNP